MSSICAECGSQVLDLKSHLKIHKDSKAECEVCGKVLSTHYSIKNEERTHNFKVKRMMGTPIHLEKLKIFLEGLA